MENAKLNSLTNTEFYAGDCGKIVAKLIDEGKKADVVVVDPPRKGCSEELLDLLRDISPRKIVYVSCNAATLARDLKYLREIGYEPKKVQPVDMFPFAGHIETVCMLHKSN